MGSSMSCVPQHNFRQSSKSFIRRNSSLFRKKHPQEGQEKSNSIINIPYIFPPNKKDMSSKFLPTMENIKWDPPFPYDPVSGWKKSSINVKNYGRLIHSSKVRFRFLHCQDIHDCYLDLFQTHLHFVSNNTTGLKYQGTLPLKELTICSVQQNCNHSLPQEFAFQINGVSLNPIIVYCATQTEMDLWFGLLKENIDANGGTAIAPEIHTRVKLNQSHDVREELRNSVNREPIYEWEGSQRDSLGAITYVTKVRLQHLPCQEQSDRLLVLYPSTLIILSEESDGLFYKGKLPLNMITVTTPCQDVKPNTFMIEGKLINPIVVSCPDRTEFCHWIQHFKNADVPVMSPPPPVYDIIYTPTHTEAEGPKFDRWSGNSQGRVESKFGQSSGSRGSQSLQLPCREENPLSPGYSEPLCFNSSRPPSIETARLGSRTNSVSSHTRPERDLRPLSLRYSSPQHSSHLLTAEGSGSELYSTPFRAGQQRPDKAPLCKSNSLNLPQTSVSYMHNTPQRHSDISPRQPLSPLYDEPCSLESYSLEEAVTGHKNWQEPIHHQLHYQQETHLLPSSFRLRTPPMARRSRRNPVEIEAPERESEQRAEAVSRLKLLPIPAQMQEQMHLPSSSARNTAQMSYGYSPGRHSYLEPREPDDQEVDYDNIWEYDSETGMIQPACGISPQWTGLNFGAQGLGAIATQQRWS